MGGATAGGMNHFSSGLERQDSAQVSLVIALRWGRPGAISRHLSREGILSFRGLCGELATKDGSLQTQVQHSSIYNQNVAYVI